MPEAEIHKLTISELAPKIRSREVSPVEVVEAALARADRFQATLNSFITILHADARRQARELEAEIARGTYRGPLHGIPLGLKDNIATGGIRTTVGTKVFADHVPEEDAHAVKLCKEAGAIILGKENLHEFAAGATSDNPHYGTVRNPWSLEHVPGGSSGGSAANVAARVTFASLGTDHGGSVRQPAAHCGVVGLKQTFGRVSQRGLLVTSFNGDHIGPLTRSVRDNALVLQAMAGYDPLDPTTVPVLVPDYSASLEDGLRGLKMGIPNNHYFDLLDPEVESAVQHAIAALEEAGAESSEVSIPSLAHFDALRIANIADRLDVHEQFIDQHRHEYGPDILYFALSGQFVLARDYIKALKVQRMIAEEHLQVLQKVDFLVAPTTPILAPRIGDTTLTVGGRERPLMGAGSGMTGKNTGPSNFTGLPAITVPCGFAEAGVPIGLQFIGRPFDEATLFRVAHAYESLSPAKRRVPGIMED